jgi:hypothetical protein
MICFEFGPMSDTDDRRVCQFLAQKLHQLTLTLMVERRGRFVQYNYVRLMKEQSGKR